MKKPGAIIDGKRVIQTNEGTFDPALKPEVVEYLTSVFEQKEVLASQILVAKTNKNTAEWKRLIQEINKLVDAGNIATKMQFGNE